jgi:hypothetical protein
MCIWLEGGLGIVGEAAGERELRTALHNIEKLGYYDNNNRRI